MDVFDLRERLVGDFSEYAKSFMNIADPAIRELVDTKLDEGLLWPEPRIQLNPAFERGASIDELVEQGVLHYLQSTCGVTITANGIIDAMRVDEVPSEIVEIIEALEEFVNRRVDRATNPGVRQTTPCELDSGRERA